MALAVKPADQVLVGTKDNALYREIGKAYDERQYKQAIKSADALLKKYPTHADTSAMKALTLNALNTKREALALAKVALRYNIKSNVCWQILGMIQRTQGNYTEAVKAYRQAWKLDPENMQVARDLALVQLHLREYQSMLETRQAMLAHKQNANFNLLQFGIAHALAGNSAFASVVLENYDLGAPPHGGPPPASNSTDDVALFRLQVLEAAGDNKKALAFAESPSYAALVVDSLGGDERRAHLLLAAGSARAAAATYWKLLRVNPDNTEYAEGLMRAVLNEAGHGAVLPGLCPLDCDARASSLARAACTSPPACGVLVALILLAVAAHPKCRTLKRLLLDVLPASHPLFKPCLGAYIRGSLRKGIPSLFSDLRWLARPPHSAGMDWAGRVAQYRESGKGEKGEVLLDLATAYYSALVADSSAVLDCYAPDTDAVTSALSADVATVRSMLESRSAQKKESSVDLSGVVAHKGDCEAESPDVLPWAGFLLARLQDEFGDAGDGVATIDAALSHSPTVIDLFMAKGRMLKHLGRHEEAVEVMDTARQLDSADRHVNNKAVEYMLRVGRVEQAEATVALFVRHDAASPDDPLAAMRMLEVSWFDLALGSAWERRGDLGPALVCYHRVAASQESFEEAAMDYHMFCMRSLFMRSHQDMLATNQAMHQHSYSIRAAEALARCYLKLHADPSVRVVKERPPPAPVAAPDGTDKAQQKPVPEKKKEDEEEPEADKKPVHDPWGSAHLGVADPLATARKYSRQVVAGCPASWAGARRGAADLAMAAVGLGKVPVAGCNIAQPSAVAGCRSSGWRTGLGLLTRALTGAAEVEVAAGKTALAAGAVHLASVAASEDPVSFAIAGDTRSRLEAVKLALLAGGAAGAGGLVTAVVGEVAGR